MKNKTIERIAKVSANWWVEEISKQYSDPNFRPKLRICVFGEKLEELIYDWISFPNSQNMGAGNISRKSLTDCLATAELNADILPKDTTMKIQLRGTSVVVYVRVGNEDPKAIFRSTIVRTMQLN